MGAEAALEPKIKPIKLEGRRTQPGHRKASPVAMAIAVSIAVHAAIGIYFVTSRFVMPAAHAALEEAVLVEMYLPQIQRDKPKPSPEPPKPQPASTSPIRTRVVEAPVVSDVEPLLMAAVEAPQVVAAKPVAALPSPVAAPADERIVEVDVDQALSSNPAPPYPLKSVQLREQGVVWLRLQIRTDGRVGEVQLKTSSGSVRLDSAAKQAVKTWKFTPARRNGQAVESWVNVPIRFSLKSS